MEAIQESWRDEVSDLRLKVTGLELALENRDLLLRTSFASMRKEMDDLWQSANSRRTAQFAASTQNNRLTPPEMEGLLTQVIDDRGFRNQLLRLVLLDMDKAQFVTQADLEAHLASEDRITPH